MQARNDISEELRSLSVLVDGISRQTPYVVPAGYFDGLAQLVLARVSAKSLVYSVPDGYFEGFASSVLERIKAGASDNQTRNQTGDKAGLSPFKTGGRAAPAGGVGAAFRRP